MKKFNEGLEWLKQKIRERNNPFEETSVSPEEVGFVPEEPPEVPEIETDVIDLPPENVDEKEVVVEHLPDETKQDVEMAEKEPGEFEDVIDKDYAQELIAQDKAEEEKASEEKAEEPAKDENPTKKIREKKQKEEPKEKSSDETLTPEELAKQEKQKKEEPKKEEQNTEKPKKEKETVKFNDDKGKQYERYPTGLKATEDAIGVVSNMANRVERLGNTQLAGSSGGADEVVRQAAIPHYDYRSFFK